MNFKFSFTMLVIAVLSSTIASIAIIPTPAFAQTTGANNNAGNNQNFNKFMACLFDNNSNGIVSESEVSEVLESTDNQPTEQKIRDCFAPIYNTGTTGGSTTTGPAATDDAATDDAAADDVPDDDADRTVAPTAADVAADDDTVDNGNGGEEEENEGN